MLRSLTKTSWLMLSIGLALGISLGVAITSWQSSSQLQLPETLLNATASHGGKTMAIATGPIADGVEGLFVLDFITGELTCSVMNPRTGAIGGAYQHNVVADLGVEQGKQPDYLMVTGAAEFRYAQGGNVRPAQSVVYIADGNTGRYAAYMLPWNRQAAQFNFAQVNPMILLGKASARNIEVE
jgi:hypothetical protein